MDISDSARWSQKGWGYVVVASAFMAAFLLDGMESCYGILMPSLLEDLGGSVAMTSFIGGLITGTALMIGPVVSKFIERFGCRVVAFVGGLTCSVSLTISTMSVNSTMFMISYGICTGLGIGMVYISYNTVVNIYFDKKRSVAMGIVTSGSGVGILIMAQLINSLISMYGWRGCYLLLAAIYAHVCAIALTMRPLKPKETSLDVDNPTENGHVQNCDPLEKSGKYEAVVTSKDDRENPNIAGNSQCSHLQNCDHPTALSSSDSTGLIQRQNSTVPLIPLDERQSLSSVKSNSNAMLSDGLKSTSQASTLERSCEKMHQKNQETEAQILLSGGTESFPLFPPNGHTSVSGYDDDHEYRGDLETKSPLSDLTLSPSHKRLPNGDTCTKSNEKFINLPSECLSSSLISLTSMGSRCGPMASVPSTATPKLPSANQKAAATNQPIRASCRSLLTDPVYLLFCYGAFSFQLAFAITPMFTPSYALHIGLTSGEAASTVSVIGICNTTGRFLAGVLSFFGLGSIRVYITGTFLAGLVCFFIPWCVNYTTLLLFAACHGFFLGVFFPLQSVLLVEILGIDQLARSFGIMCSCRSIASVLGPFLAGALYEKTQDHTLPFLLSGSIIVFASLLQIGVAVLRRPCFQRRENVDDDVASPFSPGHSNSYNKASDLMLKNESKIVISSKAY